jgi:hypothetical protein
MEEHHRALSGTVPIEVVEAHPVKHDVHVAWSDDLPERQTSDLGGESQVLEVAQSIARGLSPL